MYRPGDEIWVIQGAEMPVLLRKSEVYNGCYQLVGSCYVHGFMDAEILKKPGIEVVQVSLC